MSTLLRLLSMRHDEQRRDHPDDGLPPPVLAMTTKAQCQPKRTAHPHVHRRSSVGGNPGDGGAQRGRERERAPADGEASRDIAAERNKDRDQGGGTSLHIRWVRFKKRIGTGSTLSDSLMDALDGTSISGDTSLRRDTEGDAREPDVAARDNVFPRGWTHMDPPLPAHNGRVRVDEEPVDEIVVDNVFLTGERAGSVSHTHSRTSPPSETPHQNSGGTGTHTTPGTALSGASRPAFLFFLVCLAPSFLGTESTPSFSRWDRCVALSFLRWCVLPAVVGFFRLDFWDEEAEAGYRREMWYSSKVRAAGVRRRLSSAPHHTR